MLWMSSGFVMSFFHIDKVHGDHLRKEISQGALADMAVQLSPSAFLGRAEFSNIQTVQLQAHYGRPVYRITHDGGVDTLDAQSGEQLSPFPANYAQRLAMQHYRGDAEIRAMTLVSEPNGEVPERILPAWKVDFSDDVQTSFYISQGTGQLASVRSDIWRRHDFFWMLHIMDYRNRSDFNSPLLYSFAATGILFSISGLILLVHSFRRKDFAFFRKRPARADN